MKQTAVEWLIEQLPQIQQEGFRDIWEQAKAMEKQQMIDFVQQLKDYTRESNNVLEFDEREASEFVEIFYNKNFKSE
jgi:hypothetical protein